MSPSQPDRRGESSPELRQDAVAAVRGAESAAVPAAVRILPVSGEYGHRGGGEAQISVGFKVHLIQARFIYKVERRVSAEQGAERHISVSKALLCAF